VGEKGDYGMSFFGKLNGVMDADLENIAPQRRKATEPHPD
jgi:hypothetical protein